MAKSKKKRSPTRFFVMLCPCMVSDVMGHWQAPLKCTLRQKVSLIAAAHEGSWCARLWWLHWSEHIYNPSIDHKSSENNSIKYNILKIKMTATASRAKMNASLNDLMRCLPSHGFSLDETPASVFSRGDVGLCSDRFSEASGGKKILGCLQ